MKGTKRNITLIASLLITGLVISFFGVIFFQQNNPDRKNKLIVKELITNPSVRISSNTINWDDRDIPSHALRPNNRTHQFPQAGIPVLMYHAIETIPGNSLGVPVKQFADEMEYLHKNNYETLTLNEFYLALNSPSQETVLPAKPILLTFDDGYADNYRDAWPIMQKYGFVGTFFVITDSIGPGMMSWPDLKDLSKSGNSIESHTVHHYDLTTLSKSLLYAELKQSQVILETQLAQKVYALCFPSGRYNSQTLEAMVNNGYELGFTTEQGKVYKSDNHLKLKRLRIPGGLLLSEYEKILK